MSWGWEKLKQQQGSRGGIPPQVDEVVKQFKRFKLPGGPLAIGSIALAFMAFSSFYTIKQDEVGIVQRFGRYIETAQPGLNFKLPLGIDVVSKVNVKSVQTEEFGSAVTDVDFRPRGKTGADMGNVALMLTGDLNVAVVPWIVQYRVKDPYNFLFKVANVRQLLKDMSEATMRLVVGDRSINEVISKRDEIAVEARESLQKELDQAETGIHIVTIEMKKTNVPPSVQPSFNEVNQATQEKEQMIYQANEEYNKSVPAARGEADRTIRAAEGYALNRVNRAKGDAARFREAYEEYRKA
ncbi:FtsH protease activity modulator HflK, partial [bacterium]|nr:FtsH protease activity modulator HflK [bacterium]